MRACAGLKSCSVLPDENTWPGARDLFSSYANQTVFLRLNMHFHTKLYSCKTQLTTLSCLCAQKHELKLTWFSAAGTGGELGSSVWVRVCSSESRSTTPSVHRTSSCRGEIHASSLCLWSSDASLHSVVGSSCTVRRVSERLDGLHL